MASTKIKSATAFENENENEKESKLWDPGINCITLQCDLYQHLLPTSVCVRSGNGKMKINVEKYVKQKREERRTNHCWCHFKLNYDGLMMIIVLYDSSSFILLSSLSFMVIIILLVSFIH